MNNMMKSHVSVKKNITITEITLLLVNLYRRGYVYEV